MARIKPPCKIEGCTGFGMSLGNRGGKPYYGNVCKKHRQNARSKEVINRRLTSKTMKLEDVIEEEKAKVYLLPENTEGDITLTKSEMFNFLTQAMKKAALAVVDEILGKACTPWDYYNDAPGTESVVKVKDIGALRASLSTDQVTEK